jgi:maltose/moltooligosaccharide transporter
LFYKSWLGGNPENVVRLGGALLICAAIATLFVKVVKPTEPRS